MARDGIVILAALGLVIACGMFAGGAALGMNLGEVFAQPAGPNPLDYQPAEGECFVPPQGDGVYDEHYAGINEKNCGAFKDQSEAFKLDAEAEQIQEQTRTIEIQNKGSLTGLRIFGVVIVAIILFFLYVITR